MLRNATAQPNRVLWRAALPRSIGLPLQSGRDVGIIGRGACEAPALVQHELHVCVYVCALTSNGLANPHARR